MVLLWVCWYFTQCFICSTGPIGNLRTYVHWHQMHIENVYKSAVNRKMQKKEELSIKCAVQTWNIPSKIIVHFEICDKTVRSSNTLWFVCFKKYELFNGQLRPRIFLALLSSLDCNSIEINENKAVVLLIVPAAAYIWFMICFSLRGQLMWYV